jgi:hypothetical protein
MNMNTMKQLLAEQSQSLISELRAQVKTEVAEQIAPHAARPDLLHDDQALLKQQLSELSSQLNQKTANPPAKDTPTTQVNITPSTTNPTLSISPTDTIAIEKAKCTLNFSPITNDDLERMKNNEAEDVSVQELLKRAFIEFLDVNMSIPTSTISRMKIINISHGQEIDFQTITVEFSNMCPVNTIFKHVKNLAVEQKVSIFIPDVLAPSHEELKHQAYQLRNDSSTKHKTVIKYLGNSLALYAKKPSDRRWLLVKTPPMDIPTHTEKRPRNNDPADDEVAKKAKNVDSHMGDPQSPSNSTENAQQSLLPKPTFATVPSYSRPTPSALHTPGGGFWMQDDPRSPAPHVPHSENC